MPDGAVLVNLQYGNFESDFEDLASEFGHVALSFRAVDKWTDLEGLASLIDACDEVISIDNSIVHFAGAVGKKYNSFTTAWIRLAVGIKERKKFLLVSKHKNKSTDRFEVGTAVWQIWTFSRQVSSREPLFSRNGMEVAPCLNSSR